MLILDACRNDPVAGRANADNLLSDGYARSFNFDVRNKEVKAFITLFATSPGQRAYEIADKQRGYFTYELIEALKGKAANENGEVTLSGLVKYLQQEVPKQVRAAVGKEQKPYVLIDGYKADDLVISVTVNVGTGKTAEPQPVSSTAVELAFWDAIKNSTSPDDFKVYLQKYPNGEFAGLAKNRLASLEASSKSVEPKESKPSVSNTEIAFWDSIKNSTNAAEFRAYLNKYPNGEFAELARTKLSALEAISRPPSGTTTSPGTSAEPAAIAGVDPAFPASIVGQFVRIPAGEFQMGSNNGDNDEKPVHRVSINRDFGMGKYEVTQAQWGAVMGNNPSYFQGADLPVEKVSWDDVQQFIQILNSRSRKYNYRLPTEAEWEYACRAGSAGDYAGYLDSMAWYGFDKADKRTHPVGQKQPNAWGLYDMHGNVWEWCQDWYGTYPSDNQTDSQGPSSGSRRVLRGGSWGNIAGDSRSANRERGKPGDRGHSLGFRLVRTPR